jgi:hypothetical protein
MIWYDNPFVRDLGPVLCSVHTQVHLGLCSGQCFLNWGPATGALFGHLLSPSHGCEDPVIA